MRKKTRTWALLLVMSALLLTSLPSCRARPPMLEEVYDRLVYLIDTSVDVNVVLFGAGLPVYERDTKEDMLVHRYYGIANDGTEFVSEYARYGTVAEIEAAIRQVYSKAYADSMVETLFTGYSLGYGDSALLPPRYTVNYTTGRLNQSKSYQPLVAGTRVYNFATMRIDDSSTNKYLKIRLESRADEEGAPWMTTSLSFVYENGDWFLDGPSC